MKAFRTDFAKYRGRLPTTIIDTVLRVVGFGFAGCDFVPLKSFRPSRQLATIGFRTFNNLQVTLCLIEIADDREAIGRYCDTVIAATS